MSLKLPYLSIFLCHLDLSLVESILKKFIAKIYFSLQIFNLFDFRFKHLIILLLSLKILFLIETLFEFKSVCALLLDVS